MEHLKQLHTFRDIYSRILLLSVITFIVLPCLAQTKRSSASELAAVQNKYGLDPQSSFLSRLSSTPDDVIRDFREAGMSPTEHVLKNAETSIIATAFTTLPALHQQVLKQHLKSISFLDNMPNTALTSPVTKEEAFKLYHITFRAGILNQTISDWVTQKERACFAGVDSSLSVEVHAGMMSALTYIMLHEGTHVVDGALGLISTGTEAGDPATNIFTKKFAKGTWKDITNIEWKFSDSIAGKSRYRPGGRRFDLPEATRVYAALRRSLFISLYSTASWHEDLAEIETIYHLTHVLKQPFHLIVQQNGKDIFSYEPMRSALVKKRTRLLKQFYARRIPLHSSVK